MRVAQSPTYSALPESEGNGFERFLAAFLLAGLLLVNVALIDLRVLDFPVRAIGAIALLGAAVLIYPERVLTAVKQHTLLLALTAGFAFLGLFVSAANGTPFGEIWQGLMEVPLQAAVTVLIASVLVQLAGFRVGAFVLVAIVTASALVAMLQFLSFEPAWQLREWLADIQDEGPVEPLINRRPMGMSFSPIQLSTQLCVAFGVFAASRELVRRNLGKELSVDPWILIALMVLVSGSFVALTRSPILGAGIFVVIYMIVRPGSWLLFLGLLGAAAVMVAGPLVLDALQESAPRVVRADDGSVMARVSMNTYGLMLFADNPLGYGYAFTPSEHLTKFWQYLYYTPEPEALQQKELHNYVLNMLNTYGIGLVLLLPLVFELLKRARYSLLFFVPYMVHILFHNSGPFWTDIPFWFGVAVLSAIPRIEDVKLLSYEGDAEWDGEFLPSGGEAVAR